MSYMSTTNLYYLLLGFLFTTVLDALRAAALSLTFLVFFILSSSFFIFSSKPLRCEGLILVLTLFNPARNSAAAASLWSGVLPMRPGSGLVGFGLVFFFLLLLFLVCPATAINISQARKRGAKIPRK